MSKKPISLSFPSILLISSSVSHILIVMDGSPIRSFVKVASKVSRIFLAPTP